MRKVLSFSAFLMMGLLVSQILPGAVGEGYTTIKSVSDVLLYICLSFIMINVGREFVMDKTRWKSYAEVLFYCNGYGSDAMDFDSRLLCICLATARILA